MQPLNNQELEQVDHEGGFDNRLRVWLNTVVEQHGEHQAMVEIYTYAEDLLAQGKFGVVKALLLSADLSTIPPVVIMTLITCFQWTPEYFSLPEEFVEKLRVILEPELGTEWTPKILDGLK